MTPHLESATAVVSLISQVPVPSNLGDKLWEYGALAYMLTAAIILVSSALIYMFKKYDANVKERREDDKQTIEVLQGLTTVLRNLETKADNHVGTVRVDIKDTQGLVKEKIEDLKAHIRK